MEGKSGWGSVDRWVSRLAPSTGDRCLKMFKAWMRWVRENGGEFADFTPDELVSYQAQTDNGTKYRILDELVQAFILQKKGRAGYKDKIYSTLRSFFMHNRVELPRDASFTIRGDREKVRGTLEIEELRDLVLSSKPLYRAVFLSIFQGGMDKEAFMYWNLNGWDDLRRQLEAGEHPIKVSLPGRKMARNKEPYYTYLGRDAIDAVRDYVENYRPGSAEAIFVNQYGEPVSKTALYFYWKRHLRKIGVIKKGRKMSDRTGKSPHEARDVFRSQWEKSPAKASVAEFMLGHEVDPLEYNKACRDEGWTRREYLKAERFLNVVSSNKPFGLVDVDEVDHLNEEVRRLRGELEAAHRQLDSMTPISAEAVKLLGDPLIVEALRGLAKDRKKRP